MADASSATHIAAAIPQESLFPFGRCVGVQSSLNYNPRQSPSASIRCNLLDWLSERRPGQQEGSP